jgi:hypothetical protein
MKLNLVLNSMMFQIFFEEVLKTKNFINPKAIIKIAQKFDQTKKKNLKNGIETFFQNQQQIKN